MRDGLSYDDVLLVPKMSLVKSRKDVDTTTMLTKNVTMKMPIVSSNMDTVTESKMAMEMARHGGLGVIHRFLSVDKQVEEVLRVKRSESIVIEDPYKISADVSVAECRKLMELKGVSGFIVSNGSDLEGIVTARDILFADDKNQVKDVMTKAGDVVKARYGIGVEEARNILHKNKIEKLPLVDEHGIIKGLITSKDILKSMHYPNATKDKKGRLMVGAAVGVRGDFLERAKTLCDSGADIIVVDVAHGHSDQCMKAIGMIKESIKNVQVIAGNVATSQGTEDLIKAGADCVKVGIGPGAACTTRIVTGSGVPQLTAIMDCIASAKKYGVPVMADGGIKNSGDVTKALAAGASSVMIGSLFAGADESPGSIIHKNGTKYKIYRGMAGLGASISRKEDININEIVPEGVDAIVPYKGGVADILNQLLGGLRSGMSYSGARNIKELQEKAQFIRISAAGIRESNHHDISPF